MCLAPRHGNRLVSWSLEKFIPPMSSANGVGDCYFVFYARGFGEGKFSFWLELKVQKWTVDVLVGMWCESLRDPIGLGRRLWRLLSSHIIWSPHGHEHHSLRSCFMSYLIG